MDTLNRRLDECLAHAEHGLSRSVDDGSAQSSARREKIVSLLDQFASTRAT